MSLLPEPYRELRAYQRTPVATAVAAFEDGDPGVFFNAPPGGGKTIMSEHTRQALDVQGCISYILDTQFARIRRDRHYDGLWPAYWVDALQRFDTFAMVERLRPRRRQPVPVPTTP